MQIIVLPEDIIKRCLFNKYKRFVLKGKSQEYINKWIQENKPEVISENDAYVIGLLKVVETDNLIHQFNLYIEDFLKIKSTINNDKVIINKSSLLKEIIEFKDMFPESYKPSDSFQKSIDDLKNYISNIYSEIEKLETLQIPMRDGKTYTFVLSSEINKLVTRKP
ncbi:MAG: hypothetical protein HPY57_13975 [Ignavibacteria bacterium]|nr:hypothetical protein [Ignavibacteria bacterium]